MRLAPFGDGYVLGHIVVLALVNLSCAGIHPKAGDVCKEGDAICQGPGRVILCRAGRYIETGCTGPLGCKMSADRAVKCDQSEGATDGEACLPEYEGTGHCNADAVLQCKGGLWHAAPCASGACAVSDAGVGCKG